MSSERLANDGDAQRFSVMGKGYWEQRSDGADVSAFRRVIGVLVTVIPPPATLWITNTLGFSRKGICFLNHCAGGFGGEDTEGYGFYFVWEVYWCMD